MNGWELGVKTQGEAQWILGIKKDNMRVGEDSKDVGKDLICESRFTMDLGSRLRTSNDRSNGTSERYVVVRP